MPHATLLQRLRALFIRERSPPVETIREIVDAADDGPHPVAATDRPGEMLHFHSPVEFTFPAETALEARRPVPVLAAPPASPAIAQSPLPAEETTTVSEKFSITNYLEGCMGQVFAHELSGGKPAYLVLTSQLPAHLAATDGCWAMYSPEFDMTFRDAIGSRWRSRGPCVLLNDVELLAEFDDGEDFEGLEAAICEVFLHELAHVAVDGIPNDNAQPDFERIFATVNAVHRPFPEANNPFREHDVRFFRALIHVIARSHPAGIQPDPDAEFEKYGLSQVEDYYRALKPELEASGNLPLTAVLKTEVPAKFAVLFEQDVKEWHFRHGLQVA